MGHDQVAINIASRHGESLCIEQPDAPFALRNGNRYRPRPSLGDSESDRNAESHRRRRRARVPIFSFTSLALLSRLRARRPCCSTFAASERREPDVVIRGLYRALRIYRILIRPTFFLFFFLISNISRWRDVREKGTLFSIAIFNFTFYL